MKALKLVETAAYKVGTGDPYVTKALNCFLNTDETKARFGHYFVDGNELYYRAVVSKGTHRAMELEQNLVALKLDNGMIIGNSSALSLIGRRVSFGNERLNRAVTEVQERLTTLIPMIPFTVFEQAKLDINSFTIVDRGPEETITRTVDTGKYDKKTNKKIYKDETVHFTGASLFKVDGALFLFDLDRREIEHKIFNPFLVKLADTSVKTIPQAYESLKPAEVKEAERKGLKVKRQGEWFFIPVKETKAMQADKVTAGSWNRKVGDNLPLTLRAGNNRPNTASQGIAKLNLAKGRVEHQGREHAALMLPTWHKAIPNTSIESFTIQGDID